MKPLLTPNCYSEAQQWLQQSISPNLFNVMYIEVVFSEALGDQAGIVIRGQTISNIRYADDIALVAENIGYLQVLLDLLLAITLN